MKFFNSLFDKAEVNQSKTEKLIVNSLNSIKNAAKAGANRVELCSALGVGGVTPSAGLILEAVKLNVLSRLY